MLEVAAFVAEGRAEAEALMTARWRIERETGETEIVDYEVIPIRRLVYDGIGKLQTYEGHETTSNAGPSTVVVQRMSLHLPVGPYRCEPGDLATCISSHDPLLVGRRFRLVQGYPVKEYATAYRIFVDELLEG